MHGGLCQAGAAGPSAALSPWCWVALALAALPLSALIGLLVYWFARLVPRRAAGTA